MQWTTSESKYLAGDRRLMFSAIANQESLSILEVEMRKLEAVTKEIVDELGYLQRREMKMRDTNGQLRNSRLGSRADEAESTNERVKWFSLLLMFGIIALGAWQVSLKDD